MPKVDLKTYGDVKKVINKMTKTNIFNNVKSVLADNAVDATVALLNLAVPGISAAKKAYDIFKGLGSKPDTKKTDTWLDKLDIDDQTAAIVDDTVEAGFFQELADILSRIPDDTPLDDSFSMDARFEEYLRDKYENHYVAPVNETKMKRSQLRDVILEAYVEVLREAPEVPTPTVKPKSEKKPIPQDVKKALRKVVNSLFGSSHLDFVEKIQLVVPNPSEFQVFLKNGQSFYLKWMGKSPEYDLKAKNVDVSPAGKEGAFQAEIEGKRYYLGSLSQYEQALDRLGNLLKNGPISTAAEGGEFGAPAPEAGGFGGGGSEFPGGEAGGADTEFGAPAPEGGETPGEEESSSPTTGPGEEVPTSL